MQVQLGDHLVKAMSHCNEGLVILFKIQRVPKYLLSDITKENLELIFNEDRFTSL